MKTAFYIYTINWLFALFAQAQTLNDAYYIKIDNKILAALSETSPGIKSKGEEPHYRGFIGIDTQRPTVLKCYFDTASKKVRLEIKQAKKTRGKWALLLDKKITLTKDQSACVARLWFEVDLATLPHKDWLLEAADGLTEAPDKVIWIHELHAPASMTLYFRDSPRMIYGEDVYTASKVTCGRLVRENALISFVWLMEALVDIKCSQ